MSNFQSKNKSAASNAKITPSIQSLVQRQVNLALKQNNSTELKTRYIHWGSNVSTVFQTSAVVPIVMDFSPTMAGGTGDGSRVGEEITVVAWRLKARITQSPASNNGLHPFMVRVMIGYILSDPNNDPTTTTQFNNLLVSTVVGATTTWDASVVSTLHAPLNDDYWSIQYDKTFYIGQPGNATAQATLHDGDYHSAIDIDLDIAKWMPKTLKYSSASSGVPNNGRGPYIWFMIRDAIDYQAVTATNTPLVTAGTILTYTDK